MSAKKPVKCDAARVLRALGMDPNCSDDQYTVWHGMDTPALACGFHEKYRSRDVFKGHRARMGEDVTVTVLRENADDVTYIIPTGEIA